MTHDKQRVYVPRPPYKERRLGYLQRIGKHPFSSIEIKHHFIKDYVHKWILDLKFISNENQLADIFTKPLPEDKLIHTRNLLGKLIYCVHKGLVIHRHTHCPKDVLTIHRVIHHPKDVFSIHNETHRPKDVLRVHSKNHCPKDILNIHSKNHGPKT
ncbi:Copia protein, partial [Mucuna pruriens]